VLTTLEMAFDSLCRTIDRFMGAKMSLNVLSQLFRATNITVNVLVAGLYVGLEAFFIRKMFHTAWFYTHCLH
jgi:hypothetical protein